MMQVRDIMSVGVVHLEPDTPVERARATFLDAGISGAPVIRDGVLIGIVTKTDLIRSDLGPRDRVADIMTPEVITLSERMSVAQAARILLRHDIHRAPVIRGERIVGIVTRSDLLRPYARTDGEIQADVEHDIVARALSSGPRLIHVRVLDGVVFLEGAVRDEREHGLGRRLAAAVPGVVDIVDHLQVAPMTVARVESENGARTASTRPSG